MPFSMKQELTGPKIPLGVLEKALMAGADSIRLEYEDTGLGVSFFSGQLGSLVGIVPRDREQYVFASLIEKAGMATKVHGEITTHPPCRRRLWCQGNREIAWTEQGYRQWVILRAGEHCARVLSSLLISLEFKEAQFDELWTFVKKRNVLAAKKTLNLSTGKPGSGRPPETSYNA